MRLSDSPLRAGVGGAARLGAVLATRAFPGAGVGEMGTARTRNCYIVLSVTSLSTRKYLERTGTKRKIKCDMSF